MKPIQPGDTLYLVSPSGSIRTVIVIHHDTLSGWFYCTNGYRVGTSADVAYHATRPRRVAFRTEEEAHQHVRTIKWSDEQEKLLDAVRCLTRKTATLDQLKQWRADISGK